MYRKVNVLRRVFSSRCDERNRLSFKIKVKAENKSWLHIGTGSVKLEFSKNIPEYIDELIREGRLAPDNLKMAIDRGTITISYDYYECTRYNGKVVIPGSSLKGVCRSRIELLHRADDKGYVGSCFIRATAPRIQAPKKGTHGWRHYIVWDDVLGENRGPPCQATGKEYYEDIMVCSTCDVFGTSGLASKVFFGNLISGNAETVKLTLDFNERIEAVEPGAVFEGDITFTSCSLVEVGLVFIGLNLHDPGKPILMGKNKYRSRLVVDGPSYVRGKRIVFGIVNLEVTKIMVPYRFKGYLDNVVGINTFDIDELGFITLKGEQVLKFVNKAVSEALNANPWIKEGIKINELEILKSSGVM